MMRCVYERRLYRETFKREKHYKSVRMQQGRVLLDADWNEQADIQTYLRETEAKDVTGRCGVPKHGGGFRISPTRDNRDFVISPGRIYVTVYCAKMSHPISRR